jgi:transketolase
MIKLCDEFKTDDKEMREYYCESLISAAEKNDKIVAVDADVSFSMGTKPFYEKFPNRAFNCGIMEAHATGFAAGLSATGFIPFVHEFGTFATRRAFDQLFLAAGYQNLNVKIVGGDAGVTATSNGGTHMPFEDIALMRVIPGFTVIEPADGTLYKQLIPYAAKTYGNFYIRSTRKKVIRIYSDETEFTIGKANILTEGKDVAIIACGIMVYQALLAQKELKKSGIEASVLDMHTLKPLDKAAVIKVAADCGAIVTAENHNIIGGLGSAVDAVVSENFPVPVEKIGINDTFGEVGTQEYLMEKFHITKDDIIDKAKIAVRRKTK